MSCGASSLHLSDPFCMVDAQSSEETKAIQGSKIGPSRRGSAYGRSRCKCGWGNRGQRGGGCRSQEVGQSINPSMLRSIPARELIMFLPVAQPRRTTRRSVAASSSPPFDPAPVSLPSTARKPRKSTAAQRTVEPVSPTEDNVQVVVPSTIQRAVRKKPSVAVLQEESEPEDEKDKGVSKAGKIAEEVRVPVGLSLCRADPLVVKDRSSGCGTKH